MKVLVVEDDALVVEVVTKRLDAEGIASVSVARGNDVLAVARRERPDLVLLDLQLPGRDGFDVCRELRGDAVLGATPVIILTARGDEVDRIVGLELGADDYVIKPFSARELVLRVKAVLRRTRAQPKHDLFRAGGITLFVGERRVTLHGAEVTLAAKEFDLLHALAFVHGRVLSRTYLLRQVWGFENAESVRTRTVDVHVRQLRRKLGDEAYRVETLKGVGYRLNPAIHVPVLGPSHA